MSRSRLSPSDDKPLSTKNAKKTTPRTSTSNAGGLGEVRALSRIPAPRVHGESPRWRVGLTHRAALGGPLTARELFFRRIGLPLLLVFILLYFTAARVSGPIYSGAYCPWVSMAREAWSLSLVTCHAGFSRRGIDPVGETANVNEPPLGSRRLVVSSLACASW